MTNEKATSSSKGPASADRSRLLVATRSEDKLAEIREILSGVPGLTVVGLDDVGIDESPEEESIESFETFRENALAKARYFRERSNLPTVADDSGLVVDAIEGRPGVHSKRFAPEGGWLPGEDRDSANNRHLSELLEGVPHESRTARYVCVAALLDDSGHPRFFRGETEGLILKTPRGGKGFGYDPLFLDPESGRTFAELDRAGKAARSHRGAAFRALASYLPGRAPRTERS